MESKSSALATGLTASHPSPLGATPRALLPQSLLLSLATVIMSPAQKNKLYACEKSCQA